MTLFLIIFLSFGQNFFWHNYTFNINKHIYQADLSKLINFPVRSQEEVKDLGNQITAKAYLVRDIYGKTYFAKNFDKIFPMASLSKILTVYTALKFIPQDAIISFSQQAIDQEGFSGDFQVSERFLRDDLIKASLILSSNDAAYALAEYYGLDNTLYFIRETIKNLGLERTFMVEPTGLSAGNVSTAEDLWKLMFWFKRNHPEVASWTLEKQLELKGNKKRKVANIAIRLLEAYGNYIKFQKTGFTDEARQNYMAVIKINNSPEIGVIILGSENREQDFKTILEALKKNYE